MIIIMIMRIIITRTITMSMRTRLCSGASD